MTGGDMDDASSALIARLLQEENYAYGGNEYFEPDSASDEEFGKKRKRKKKKKTPAKSTAKQQKTGSTNDKPNDSTTKRKRTPRGWTADQEKLFLEALDLFGRDWKRCAEHIGHDRLPRDVSSHAQKHFIKLYKQDKPLPAKVLETGAGYTLSGKPLDPDSSAARAYGVRGSTGRQEYRESLSKEKSTEKSKTEEPAQDDTKSEKKDDTKEMNPSPTNDETAKDTEQLSARALNDKLLREMKEKGVKLGQVTNHTDKEKEKAERREEAAKVQAAKAIKKRQREIEKLAEKRKRSEIKESTSYDENGLTEYSRNRTRRRVASRYVAEPTAALQFVRCTRYNGIPGSGERKSQPFIVKVHSNVNVLADFHAHTTKAEVIGFLAGKWDPENRVITVCEAYPGRSVHSGNTECEMDPVVEVELRSTIESKGLSVVGWYHSHPTFEAIPSMCDIDNQSNYQTLFRDGRSGEEPFIALIVSPYDMALSGNESVFSWFYAEGPCKAKVPKLIDTELVADEGIDKGTIERMKTVAKNIDDCPFRVIFDEIWRDLGNEAITFRKKIEYALKVWSQPLVGKRATAAKRLRLEQCRDSSLLILDTKEEGNQIKEENEKSKPQDSTSEKDTANNENTVSNMKIETKMTPKVDVLDEGIKDLKEVLELLK